MGAVHDVLRYLLERVPHSTQEDHDRVADLIAQDETTGAADATEDKQPGTEEGN